MAGPAENPFSTLLLMMREQGSKGSAPGWGVGEVASADPLRITFGGVTLEPAQLFIPDWLSASRWLPGAKVALLPDAKYELFLILGERTV